MTSPAPGAEAQRAREAIARLIEASGPLEQLARVRAGGLRSSEARVLLELSKVPRATLASLTARLGTDAAWLSRTVTRLSTAGFVERVAVVGDRRQAEIRLRPAGERQARAIASESEALWRAALQRLGATHRGEWLPAIEALGNAAAAVLESTERSP